MILFMYRSINVEYFNCFIKGIMEMLHPKKASQYLGFIRALHQNSILPLMYRLLL